MKFLITLTLTALGPPAGEGCWKFVREFIVRNICRETKLLKEPGTNIRDDHIREFDKT